MRHSARDFVLKLSKTFSKLTGTVTGTADSETELVKMAAVDPLFRILVGLN